ncbi:MAG: DUF4369 domain-containing protein, partial [Saprospiraceae bacterium]|nr:DUF4369 domain-containing protein [Saprospiraceae bacterium]
MKSLLPLFIFFVVSGQLFSQHNIKFNIDHYANDTVMVGYYYGDRQLSKDTVIRNDKGKFVFEGKDTLDKGVYILLLKPNYQYVQFLIDDEPAEFEMKFDTSDLSDIQFKGSKFNKEFYSYLDFLTEQRSKADKIRSDIKAMEANGRLDNEVLNLQLTAIDKEVKERQHKIVDENPHSVLAMLIRANFENPIPEFKGTEEEVQLKRYLYYKEHYFDHIDFKNQALIRTPFI